MSRPSSPVPPRLPSCCTRACAAEGGRRRRRRHGSCAAPSRPPQPLQLVCIGVALRVGTARGARASRDKRQARELTAATRVAPRHTHSRRAGGRTSTPCTSALPRCWQASWGSGRRAATARRGRGRGRGSREHACGHASTKAAVSAKRGRGLLQLLRNHIGARLNRGEDGTDVVDRAPLVLEDVQADAPVRVDCERDAGRQRARVVAACVQTCALQLAVAWADCQGGRAGAHC